MASVPSTPHKREASSLDARALFAAFAGLCGSLVAVGLARFAYTPLIPSMIQAHWFSSAQTVALGAANFAGYLIGAMAGRPLAAKLSNRSALRFLMVTVTIAFFACARPVSVSWFFFWRLMSGFSGGAIMVLVATSILPHIPAPRRGFASGMIFLGLGLGVAASGTLIPQLLATGLRDAWLGLGVLSLSLTALSWFGWPATNPPVAQAASTHTIEHGSLALRVLYAQYAANALGLVPVIVLLVDYIARGLGRGAAVGADYWVLYGLAAIAGPIICSNLGSRFGFRAAWRAGLALQAIAIVILAKTGNPYVPAGATAILGVFTPGIVPLVLGRINELVPDDFLAQRAAWSRATMAFALFQALGGYGHSYLFSRLHDDYLLVFLCGAGALALAFVADVLMRAPRTELSGRLPAVRQLNHSDRAFAARYVSRLFSRSFANVALKVASRSRRSTYSPHDGQI